MRIPRFRDDEDSIPTPLLPPIDPQQVYREARERNDERRRVAEAERLLALLAAE